MTKLYIQREVQINVDCEIAVLQEPGEFESDENAWVDLNRYCERQDVSLVQVLEATSQAIFVRHIPDDFYESAYELGTDINDNVVQIPRSAFPQPPFTIWDTDHWAMNPEFKYL